MKKKTNMKISRKKLKRKTNMKISRKKLWGVKVKQE